MENTNIHLLSHCSPRSVFFRSQSRIKRSKCFACVLPSRCSGVSTVSPFLQSRHLGRAIIEMYMISGNKAMLGILESHSSVFCKEGIVVPSLRGAELVLSLYLASL